MKSQFDSADSFAMAVYSNADHGPSSGSRCSTTKVYFEADMIGRQTRVLSVVVFPVVCDAPCLL